MIYADLSRILEVLVGFKVLAVFSRFRGLSTILEFIAGWGSLA